MSHLPHNFVRLTTYPDQGNSLWSGALSLENSRGPQPRPRSLFLCHQRQSLPPPDNFPVLFAEAEQVARGLRRAGNEFEDFCAVLRRCGGGVEIPVEIGLLERGQLSVVHGQAALSAEVGPLAGSEEPMVAGIAELFDLMHPFFGFGLIVLDGAVDQ